MLSLYQRSIILCFCFWGFLCFLIGCQANQDNTSLAQTNVLLQEDFDLLDTTQWMVSQQTNTLGTEAESSFTLASSTETIETDVFKNNIACLSGNNINFANDQLRLSAINQNVTCFATETSFSYTGGELRSATTYQYGIFTFRLKTSLVAGALTSVFLQQGTEEIGIHFRGDNSKTVLFSLTDDGTSRQQFIQPEASFLGEGSAFNDFDTSTQEHDYQLVWHEDIIEWSIDGQPFFSIQQHGIDDPMQLIMVTWVTSDDEAAGSPSSALSVFSDVDFITIQEIP